MKPTPTRDLSMLRAGKTPTAPKINLSYPRVIELAGLAGADAVWLCTGHMLNDGLRIENQIHAARVHGIDCLVRVTRGSYSDYIRPIEADASDNAIDALSLAQDDALFAGMDT